jgi:hypothetical protein
MGPLNPPRTVHKQLPVECRVLLQQASSRFVAAVVLLAPPQQLPHYHVYFFFFSLIIQILIVLSGKTMKLSSKHFSLCWATLGLFGWYLRTTTPLQHESWLFSFIPFASICFFLTPRTVMLGSALPSLSLQSRLARSSSRRLGRP